MFDISDAPIVVVAGLEITGHMPFAGHQRLVAISPQMFGNGSAVVAQKPLIGGGAQICPHMPNARIVRIEPSAKRPVWGNSERNYTWQITAHRVVRVRQCWVF